MTNIIRKLISVIFVFVALCCIFMLVGCSVEVVVDKHDTNVTIVIISAVLSMIAFAVVEILNLVKKFKDRKYTFVKDCSGQQEIGRIIGSAFVGGGGVGGLAFWFLYFIGVMSIDTATFSIVFFTLAMIGGLCWYVCGNIEDELVGNTYVKKRPFRKKQIAKLSQIAEVNIAKIKDVWIVKICDKNRKTLVNYKVYDEQINASTLWLSFIENKLPIRMDAREQSLHFIKNILDSLLPCNANTMLCFVCNGKTYNVIYNKSYCTVSNEENVDNVTKFSSLEEVYEKYLLDGTALKYVWDKFERCEIVANTVV